MASNPFDSLDSRLLAIEHHLSIIAATLDLNRHSEQQDSIDIDEVSKILRLSKATLYTRTHLKTIPHRKIGKKLLFSRRQIEAYLNSGQVKTLSDHKSDAEAYRITELNNRRRTIR